jgi:hypothetical protein
MATSILLACIAIKPLNDLCKWSWRFATLPTFDKSGLEKNFKELSVNNEFNRTLKDGDKILQWQVIGDFKKTNGLDIATEEDTSIYAVGKPLNRFDIGKMFSGEIVRVECNQTEEGLTAIAKSSLMPEHEFFYHYLKSCDAGGSASGAIIATTSNKLHFAVKYKGQFIDPPSGFVLWAFQGKQPIYNSPKPIVERLRNAIISQESGHDPKAVNPDSSALGLGQVMPENIKSWSKQCLGQEITEDEFLHSKDKQLNIIDCKLKEGLEQTAKSAANEEEQIRQVAAIWYSGDPKLFDDGKPQTYGSGSYPSVRDYTMTVLDRYKKQ